MADTGSRRRESLWVGGIAFIFFLAFGVYMAVVRHYLPVDSIARMMSAWLVYNGTEFKMASIGFVWPPLPALALLPFVWIPFLVKTWLALVIVSALSMAFACVFLSRMLVEVKVPFAWRVVIIVLFVTHPMIVLFGANGMSEAILIAALFAACHWLIRYWRTDRNLNLLISAGFFGLLPLVRYEMALLVALVPLLIALQLWGRRGYKYPQPMSSVLEGRWLAYGAMAIYPIFLWAVFSWQIMGSPIYFISNERSALNVASTGAAGFSFVAYETSLFASIILALKIWSLTYLVGPISSVIGVAVGIWRKKPFLIGLAIWPLSIPLLQALLIYRQATVPLIRYYMVVIPLGIAISLATWRTIWPDDGETWRPSPAFARWGLLALVVLMLISNIVGGYFVATYEVQDYEYKSWQALTTEEPVRNEEIEDGEVLGKVLPRIVPEGSKILLDLYGGGYAVELGTGSHDLFLDHSHPDFLEAIKTPQEYADYILVPAPEGRALTNEINLSFPNLYNEGATWAEEVEGLPVTSYRWKLYKILK